MKNYKGFKCLLFHTSSLFGASAVDFSSNRLNLFLQFLGLTVASPFSLKI